MDSNTMWIIIAILVAGASISNAVLHSRRQPKPHDPLTNEKGEYIERG